MEYLCGLVGFVFGAIICGAASICLWRDQVAKIEAAIKTKYENQSSSYFLGRKDQTKASSAIQIDSYNTIAKLNQEIERLTRESYMNRN